ncbi:hypothetical protein NDU88_004773, partial [Pleurodeles waltl]
VVNDSPQVAGSSFGKVSDLPLRQWARFSKTKIEEGQQNRVVNDSPQVAGSSFGKVSDLPLRQWARFSKTKIEEGQQ